MYDVDVHPWWSQLKTLVVRYDTYDLSLASNMTCNANATQLSTGTGIIYSTRDNNLPIIEIKHLIATEQRQLQFMAQRYLQSRDRADITIPNHSSLITEDLDDRRV